MRLLYIANARIPTEKAHGLQIMQNCEAFADVGGLQVTLWAARRVNTPDMRSVPDPYAYYGVKTNFDLRRIPCLDLLVWVADRNRMLTRLAFFLQVSTFTLMAWIFALFTRADVYYSRDLPVILALSFIKPWARIAYEPHRRSQSSLGRRLQNWAVNRAGTTIPITPRLAEDLIADGADAQRILPAHDGIRRERFAHMSDQATARREIGWPLDVFIVGYVGRLHTLSMDKGVGILIDAICQMNTERVALALVGGPDDMAAALRQQWISAGLPADHFLYTGQVLAPEVPLYLSAFDVCAMPHPQTEQFAHYTSPLKLFEYMAANRPIVASAMPGWADVVTDGESALLVPPGDVAALTDALTRLYANPALRAQLAQAAQQRVLAHYTWDARARHILHQIQVGQHDR